jgi:hypothetical protein
MKNVRVKLQRMLELMHTDKRVLNKKKIAGGKMSFVKHINSEFSHAPQIFWVSCVEAVLD